MVFYSTQELRIYICSAKVQCPIGNAYIVFLIKLVLKLVVGVTVQMGGTDLGGGGVFEQWNFYYVTENAKEAPASLYIAKERVQRELEGSYKAVGLDGASH